MSNRTYKPAYLAQGERALIVRALRFFMHEQQVLITQARAKYAKRPDTLADHVEHSQKQIVAAEALFERFRSGGVNQEPSNES